MTATEQLSRILYILPAAAGEGRSIGELADALGVEPARVVRDLEEVVTRAYYHPSGGAEDIQLLIEGDRISVWTTKEFQRPVRLLPREALTLGLGLRVLAAECPEPRSTELLELAQRLERDLATRSPEELLPRYAVHPGAGAGLDSRGETGLRPLLADAAAERRRCRISYLKPGEPRAETREIRPYCVVSSEGRWYVLAHSEEADDVRAFRLDRVIEAAVLEERFEAPERFDPSDYLDERGYVFFTADDAALEVRARVRYSPRIARFVAEAVDVEEQEDGSVVAVHRVADPGWLIRHVLAHAPEAELLEPREWRGRVGRSLSIPEL